MRQSKYNAVPTVIDGIRFASKAEAKRYGELKLLQSAGLIFGLELQPKFPIEINGSKICTYIADFKYFRKTSQDQAAGSDEITEDVKGMLTPVYKLKKKMVEAQYNITITEIKR